MTFGTLFIRFYIMFLLPSAHSLQPGQHQAPLTRRSLSSPGPQRYMEECGSGCGYSSKPPASPSQWDNRTLPPAPASPPPGLTGNMVKGEHGSLLGMEASTEPCTQLDLLLKKDVIVLKHYVISTIQCATFVLFSFD